MTLQHVKRKAICTKTSNKSGLFGTELELAYNPIALELTKVEYNLEEDKQLLLLSVRLAAKGKDNGAEFLHEIVFRHLKFLRHKGSHKPLLEIEKFLGENRDKEDLHWFEYRLGELKEYYMEILGKKESIYASVNIYNELKSKRYLPVDSPVALLDIVREILDTDIRLWIEEEGAYKFINELARKGRNKNAEDFIQKSVKSQIELALLKRGVRNAEIRREEQLLDDKRVDFLISYGFVGRILLELKLANSSEAIPSRQNSEAYVKKLKSYVSGTDADFGLFVIFNVEETKTSEQFEEQLVQLNNLYMDEGNIYIVGLNCI